jgi:hypothetical protein
MLASEYPLPLAKHLALDPLRLNVIPLVQEDMTEPDCRSCQGPEGSLFPSTRLSTAAQQELAR